MHPTWLNFAHAVAYAVAFIAAYSLVTGERPR